MELAGPTQTRSQRRQAVTAHIPQRYSPVFHLAFPTLLGLAVLGVAVWFLHDLRPAELLAVPLTLFLGFGFEWRAHKDILHKRTPGLTLLYDRHELLHHVIYTYDDMALRSRRELWLILMPAYAIVLAFGMVAPLGLVLAWLVSTNVALLFVATSMVFFLAYEWLHMAYHLPETSLAFRLPLLGRLREQHRRHHDPRLMKRWNFNVTVPLFDVLHGTLWSPAREAAKAARRRPRAGGQPGAVPAVEASPAADRR